MSGKLTVDMSRFAPRNDWARHPSDRRARPEDVLKELMALQGIPGEVKALTLPYLPPSQHWTSYTGSR